MDVDRDASLDRECEQRSERYLSLLNPIRLGRAESEGVKANSMAISSSWSLL
jgi:hypothetical protein